MRRIVILDRLGPADGAPATQVRLRYVVRLAVPAALRERFAGQRERFWPDPLPDEVAALRAGEVTEQVREYTAPAGVTWAQLVSTAAVRTTVLAEIAAAARAAQTALDADAAPHPLYGSVYDGSVWMA